jgi:hypothetical protein
MELASDEQNREPIEDRVDPGAAKAADGGRGRIELQRLVAGRADEPAEILLDEWANGHALV